MWDTIDCSDSHSSHLTHDMPCQRCGHALHTFLSCGDTCDCLATALPGEPALAA